MGVYHGQDTKSTYHYLLTSYLDAGVAPQEIPLPHEFLVNRDLMAQLYPSFNKGLVPFFTLNWSEYSDFLTFKGGLNPITGGLWLSDTAHHHLALAVLFIVAGHMYRTNWGIGHSMKEILEAHKGPFTGEGHKGMYEILNNFMACSASYQPGYDGICKYHCGSPHVCYASISLYCNRLSDATIIIHTPYVDWWFLCYWSCSPRWYIHG